MFEKAFNQLTQLEGAYSDNPNDSGGATKFGITESVARENGYNGDMILLPLETAQAIYKKQYWDVMQLDAVAELSYDIAYELFETGVNMGCGVAIKFLQRTLNLFINTPPKLQLDGVMGSESLQHLNEILVLYSASQSILKTLSAQQGVRYMEIVENDHSQGKFLAGWLNRVQL